MIPSELLFAPFLLSALMVSFQIDKGRHRRLKTYHACFVLFLVLWHCRVFRLLGSTIIAPSAMYERVAEVGGILPDWFHTPFWTASLLLYVISVIVGFSAAKRNPSSIRKLMLCIPALWVFDMINTSRDLIGLEYQQNFALVPIIFVSTALGYGIVYTPMFFFYRSAAVRDTLFPSEVVNSSDESISTLDSDPA